MKKISVGEYILNSGKWEEMLILLRDIVLDSGLKETVKWNIPVYRINGKNVVGIIAYKNWVTLIFYNGALLSDEKKLFHQPEEKARALRQWRFSSLDNIRDHIESIIEYVDEAKENALRGKRIMPEKNRTIIIPAELNKVFENDPGLKKIFDSLSNFRQYEYSQYINMAKLPETRERRVKRVIDSLWNNQANSKTNFNL